MKELSARCVNYALLPSEDNKRVVGIAELILVTSEPSYSVDLSGQINKARSLDQMRLSLTARGLRQLAEQFTQYATDLDELQKCFSPAEAGEETA